MSVSYQIAGSVKFKNNDTVNYLLDQLTGGGIEIDVVNDTPEVLEVEFKGIAAATTYHWVQQFEQAIKSLSPHVLEPVELWTECEFEEGAIKLPA